MGDSPPPLIFRWRVGKRGGGQNRESEHGEGGEMHPRLMTAPLRLVGVICPRLTNGGARWLPFSVPIVSISCGRPMQRENSGFPPCFFDNVPEGGWACHEAIPKKVRFACGSTSSEDAAWDRDGALEEARTRGNDGLLEWRFTALQPWGCLCVGGCTGGRARRDAPANGLQTFGLRLLRHIRFSCKTQKTLTPGS